ncbi:helix-turn-helix domain-containing protein [Pseudoclavibacter sp. 13-3]|uniref:helix-turn-helix domain-containing protein n=1 Tax=Pseudoclavibacter sp. 13-3 TaxID=2901228 RepID=UPI001E58D1AB|nr:helix-turn-helix transcriptional regulator [Pseudoclavibacter sp. 13-3]
MAHDALTLRRLRLARQLAERSQKEDRRLVAVVGASGVGKSLVAARVQEELLAASGAPGLRRSLTLDVGLGQHLDPRVLRRRLLREVQSARLERSVQEDVERGDDERAILRGLTALAADGLALRIENADRLDTASAQLISEAMVTQRVVAVITTRDRTALPEALYEQTRRAGALVWRLPALDTDETSEVVEAHLQAETHWRSTARLHMATAGNPELLAALLDDLDEQHAWQSINGIELLRGRLQAGPRVREHVRRLLRRLGRGERDLLLATALAGSLPVRSVEVLSSSETVDLAAASGLFMQLPDGPAASRRVGVQPEITRQALLADAGRGELHRALLRLQQVPASLRAGWGAQSEAEIICRRLDLEPETLSAAELLNAVAVYVEAGDLAATLPLLETLTRREDLTSEQSEEATFQRLYSLLRTGRGEQARAELSGLRDPLTRAFAGLWFAEGPELPEGLDAQTARVLTLVREIRRGEAVEVAALDAVADDGDAPARLRWLACAYALLGDLSSGAPLTRVERIERALVEMQASARRVDRWIANELVHAHLYGLLCHRRPWGAFSVSAMIEGVAQTSVDDANASLGLGVIAGETGDLRIARTMLRQGLALLHSDDPTGLREYAVSAVRAVEALLDDAPRADGRPAGVSGGLERSGAQSSGAQSLSDAQQEHPITGASRMFRADIRRRDLMTSALTQWQKNRREGVETDWNEASRRYDAAISAAESRSESWSALRLVHDRARLLPLPVPAQLVACAHRQAENLDGELAEAMLRFITGRGQEEPEMLATAADLFEQVGRPVQAAECEATRAGLLRACGDRSDADAALWRMHGLLAEVGQVNTPLLGRARWDDPRLSRRERQIAPLAGQRLTNREIADRLVLSQRTVEGHVQRILARLGIDHRGRLMGDLGDRLPGSQE